MAKRPGMMSIGFFCHPSGHHPAAWRSPEVPRDAARNVAHLISLAQTAERGLLDMFFLADASAVRAEPRWSDQYLAILEPIGLLSAISRETSHIGLVATASTTFNAPYVLARKFASLDIISGGRAGWNLVTSAGKDEANNFSSDGMMDHGLRYARASEAAKVVQGLWRSWDADAFVQDRESGVYTDVSKMHKLDHSGEYFSVKGPLNISRSPQGQPVLVQAGSSADGRDLSANYAEVIFTGAQTLEDATAFYSDMGRRIEAAGRDPDHVKIMPGLSAVIGRTRQEAEDRYGELQRLITDDMAMSQLVEGLSHPDMRDIDINAKLTDLPPSQGAQHFRSTVLEMARREGLSFLQVAHRTANARGHKIVVGTATEICDMMEEWYDERGADGFNLMPPVLPTDLESFVDEVVPELQRRGRFRREYQGGTLREHLNLPTTMPALTNLS